MTRLRENARRNIRHGTSTNRQWTKCVLIAALATTLLCGADVALGQEGRFYVGTTGVLELLDASYDKTTDNTDPVTSRPSAGRYITIQIPTLKRALGSASWPGIGVCSIRMGCT